MGIDHTFTESLSMINFKVSKTSQGFILVACLATLLLLSLLALAAADRSLLLTKQAANQWLYWNTLANLNVIQQTLIKQNSFIQPKNCQVSYRNDDYYWQNSAEKWNGGCQLNSREIPTLSAIETLPLTSCIKQNKQLKRVKYLRLTTSTLNYTVKLKVQSIIVILSAEKDTCVPDNSQLSLGLLSWRME